jgi:hypothetical protein
MMEAQDMFKNSNKVTRPEKALILGFMAGSRGIILYLLFELRHDKTNIMCLRPAWIQTSLRIRTV